MKIIDNRSVSDEVEIYDTFIKTLYQTENPVINAGNGIKIEESSYIYLGTDSHHSQYILMGLDKGKPRYMLDTASEYEGVEDFLNSFFTAAFEEEELELATRFTCELVLK